MCVRFHFHLYILYCFHLQSIYRCGYNTVFYLFSQSCEFFCKFLPEIFVFLVFLPIFTVFLASSFLSSILGLWHFLFIFIFNSYFSFVPKFLWFSVSLRTVKWFLMFFLKMADTCLGFMCGNWLHFFFHCSNFGIPVSNHKQHIFLGYFVSFRLTLTLKLINFLFFCISVLR